MDDPMKSMKTSMDGFIWVSIGSVGQSAWVSVCTVSESVRRSVDASIRESGWISVRRSVMGSMYRAQGLWDV